MTIKFVLWDFGDTIVDQNWMLRAPEGYPQWSEVWVEEVTGRNEDAWFLNEVGYKDIAQRVSQALDMPITLTLNHIHKCCIEIKFYEKVLTVIRNCRLPQAIVTLNPDVFSQFVVPHYRLNDLFPVIVTSWQEQTLSKTELCTKALELLGGNTNYSEAMLIDNIASNVEEWRKLGGLGYIFTDEDSFVANLESDLSELAG